MLTAREVDGPEAGQDVARGLRHPCGVVRTRDVGEPDREAVEEQRFLPRCEVQVGRVALDARREVRRDRAAIQKGCYGRRIERIGDVEGRRRRGRDLVEPRFDDACVGVGHRDRVGGRVRPVDPPWVSLFSCDVLLDTDAPERAEAHDVPGRQPVGRGCQDLDRIRERHAPNRPRGGSETRRAGAGHGRDVEVQADASRGQVGRVEDEVVDLLLRWR